MITKKFDHDLHLLYPTRTFRITVTAPNGDVVKFHELTPEQAETMWRMYEDLAPAGWDLRWQPVGYM